MRTHVQNRERMRRFPPASYIYICMCIYIYIYSAFFKQALRPGVALPPEARYLKQTHTHSLKALRPGVALPPAA